MERFHEPECNRFVLAVSWQLYHFLCLYKSLTLSAPTEKKKRLFFSFSFVIVQKLCDLQFSVASSFRVLFLFFTFFVTRSWLRNSISCCVLWGRSRCQIQTFVTFYLFWVIAACPGGKVRQWRTGSMAIQVFGSCLCHFSMKVNFFQHLCFYYFIGFGVRSLT